MSDMKKFKMDLPEIGKIEIGLTEDQLKQSLVKGKQISDVSRAINMDDYVYRDNDSVTSNTPGGMTGNAIDWASFYPKVTDAEIEELVQKAVSQVEIDFTFLRTISSLLTMALNSYIQKSKGNVSLETVEEKKS